MVLEADIPHSIDANGAKGRPGYEVDENGNQVLWQLLHTINYNPLIRISHSRIDMPVNVSLFMSVPRLGDMTPVRIDFDRASRLSVTLLCTLRIGPIHVLFSYVDPFHLYHQFLPCWEFWCASHVDNMGVTSCEGILTEWSGRVWLSDRSAVQQNRMLVTSVTPTSRV